MFIASHYLGCGYFFNSQAFGSRWSLRVCHELVWWSRTVPWASSIPPTRLTATKPLNQLAAAVVVVVVATTHDQHCCRSWGWLLLLVTEHQFDVHQFDVVRCTRTTIFVCYPRIMVPFAIFFVVHETPVRCPRISLTGTFVVRNPSVYNKEGSG